MKTIRQPFFTTKTKQASVGRKREDDVYEGMFMTQEDALKDENIKKAGKQNKNRGTLYKRRRKTAHESRRRNRGK